MRPIPFNALAKLLELRHSCQTLILGVSIDSRRIHPGDLFFALPGNRTDGHSFIQEAAAKGAVGVVVREDFRGDACGLPLLHVPDVLSALQNLARTILAKRKTKVVAITGSLGKTTTKEFASTLLKTKYRIFASPLSFNSQATVPLSILMADGTEDYLLLEMGMTHEGNISNLISIAPPDISVLTTVAIQHANNFADGLAGISREKSQIFSHPHTQLGIVNHDIDNYDAICAIGTCPKKSFSIDSCNADFYLERLPLGVRIFSKGELPYDISIHLPMHAQYQNFLAAVVLARCLEIPWPMIQETAPFLKLPAMRFEKVERQGILFINDAYNANPDSMKAALESLPKPINGGKVIAVLSEMDALGMYTEEGHALVAETALQYADLLLCLGARCETMHKIWKREKRPCEIFANRVELAAALKKIVKEGDVVLLKGARAHALDQLLDHFHTSNYSG